MGAYHVQKVTRTIQKLAPTGTYIYVLPVDKQDNPERTYELLHKKTDKLLARMTTQALPGCCGVMVLYNFYGKSEFVNQLIEVGETAARKNGYGLTLFTMRVDSPALTRAGTTFINGKTGNEIAVILRDLQQEPKKKIEEFVVSE